MPDLPREGEIWRNSKGAERHVRSVDEDARWVMYSRPAPAPADWMTVTMCKWLEWAENATRMRKPVAAQSDWGYQTNA